MASAVFLIRQNTNRSRQVAACKRAFKLRLLTAICRADFEKIIVGLSPTHSELNVQLKKSPLSLSICNIVFCVRRIFSNSTTKEKSRANRVIKKLLTQVLATKSMIIYYCEQNRRLTRRCLQKTVVLPVVPSAGGQRQNGIFSCLLQHASMPSRDRQYFLAKLIEISLNVNALVYSFETVIFI